MSAKGRPKLAKNLAKDGVVKFRASPAEMADMKKAAKASKGSLSAWARQILLAEAHKPR